LHACRGHCPKGGVRPSGRMCSVLGTPLEADQTRDSCVCQLCQD
jgi:hypothetical protein